MITRSLADIQTMIPGSTIDERFLPLSFTVCRQIRAQLSKEIYTFR